MVRGLLIFPLLAIFPAAGWGAQEDPEVHVAELVDDGRRWNAGRAMRALARRGEAAFPALRRALASEDWQQRQLAAELLRRGGAEADAALVWVTVEGLRDDWSSFGREGERNLMLLNAARGFEWLRARPEVAGAELRECLIGDDAQQRFLAAVLLGVRGVEERSERICAILIPHLRDNGIPNDARMALAALERLGPEAWRHAVQALTESRDRQQIVALEWLLTPPEWRTRDCWAVSTNHDVDAWAGFGLWWRDFNERAPVPIPGMP